MERYLGIDYGRKNIGLAISSEGGNYAFEYQTLLVGSLEGVIHQLGGIIAKEKITHVVIGLPLNQNGEEGKFAKEVKDFGSLLGNFTQVNISYLDERFSSALVFRQAHEAGKNEKRLRSSKDQKSAQIILQTYLDKKNA